MVRLVTRLPAICACCLDLAAHKVKDCRQQTDKIREEQQMGKNGIKRGPDRDPHAVSRRAFLSKGAAGVGAAALVGTSPNEAAAQAVKWDLSADVVIIGAGVSGLAAAITARDSGASVISVDENFDIGGRGMLSGGRVHLGGG